MEDNAISITPEVAPPAKKKPRRSAKSKFEQPQNHEFSTVDTPRAQEPSQAVEPRLSSDPEPPKPANGGSGKPVYEWDRTIAEETRRKTPFPTPKATTLSFDEFCEYYNALREMPVSTYARLYVQRWWPVLLPVEKQDEYGNIKEGFPSDVKVSIDDGPLSQPLMLQLAGVGQYKFRLNDTRRPWVQQTVVFSEVEMSDRSLWNLNRPVLDYKRLDLDHNRNQQFILFARSVGLLPREDETEKEQSDMAQVAVIDSVLADARKERDRADQIQREQLARAEREAQVARAEAAAAKVEEPKPTAPASELLSVVSSVATLAKSLQAPKDDSLSEYLKLQTEREKTEREREREERQALRDAAATERARAEKLQAETLAELREKVNTPAPAATPMAAPVPPKTLTEQFQEMETVMGVAKRLTGRKEAAEEEEKPSKIDKWLEAAPVLSPIIQGLVGGFFRTIEFGLQSWQTVSYNNALARNGTTPQPPTVMNSQQQQPQPGQPAAAQGPPPTPEQQAQQQRIMIMLKALEDAANPILVAFSKDETGDSAATAAGAKFADTIISFKGRPDYDLIRSVGENPPGTFSLETFTANVKFLLNHPGRGPNTAHLAAQVAPKPSFGQFLAGFFNYDLIQADLQKQAEEQQ